jgi:hypothetical protein
MHNPIQGQLCYSFIIMGTIHLLFNWKIEFLQLYQRFQHKWENFSERVSKNLYPYQVDYEHIVILNDGVEMKISTAEKLPQLGSRSASLADTRTAVKSETREPSTDKPGGYDLEAIDFVGNPQSSHTLTNIQLHVQNSTTTECGPERVKCWMESADDNDRHPPTAGCNSTVDILAAAKELGFI